MTGDAKRIKMLRERIGKSAGDIALLAGLGDMAYYDVEAYDGELRTALSLQQVKRLADALAVPSSALFSDEVTNIEHRVSYDELVVLVTNHFDSGVSRATFEDEIGWDLSPFLGGESRALSEYGVDFLQALCGRIGVDWVAALP